MASLLAMCASTFPFAIPMATCDLKSFDVQARGVAAIAEEWKLRHDDVRSVWAIDEVIEALTDCLRKANQVYDDFRLGRITDPAPFAHYVATFRLIINAGRQICAMMDARDRGGMAELELLLTEVQEIVDEDGVTQAFHAFDEWK